MKRGKRNWIGWSATGLLILAITLAGCKKENSDQGDPGAEEDPSQPVPAGLLGPEHFTYRGAFRLPAGDGGVNSFSWGGMALAYYPSGDPSGSGDGYPGSLFITGHEWEHRVAEVSIPAPRVSAAKNVGDLATAAILQPFADLFRVGRLEIPRAGLAYLPAQGSQSSEKLYLCWGAHYQEAGSLTHAWCGLDLANPGRQGDWYLSVPHHEYNSNGYLFSIPANWASAHTPEKRLATGRFRDGGWSGQGPALFAVGPWNQGNPPPNRSALDQVTLLRYTSSEDYGETAHVMNGYHHSDEWTGGAWATTAERAAVVFAGTKGIGDCWYGNENGPCLDCENRGWWSDEFRGRLIFYDPGELAKVATGAWESWRPQPYSRLDIDDRLFAVTGSQQKRHTGGICCDRERGILFLAEFRGDGDLPLIHVWKIGN